MSNIIRTLVGGRLNEFSGVDTRGQAPVVFTGVIFDIFNDINSLTEEKKNELKRLVSNPTFVDLMPMNSVLALVTSEQQSSFSIIFPFFQSHLMLPVQVGEQIYIIYNDYSNDGGQLGRWISRPIESYTIEDVNYTHGDRKFDPITNNGQQDIVQVRNRIKNQTEPPKPSFPNGGGTQESFTLTPSRESPDVNPYDKIVSDTDAGKQHVFEPVPRWTKRPQELILQGMNNSMIMLGQDRISAAKRETNQTAERTKYSGTIDLVAGRGRIQLNPSENTTGEGKETSTLTVLNTRNKLETDKTPKVRNRQQNQREGDTNFKSDASRIYVSMNTAGDKNFRLVHDEDGMSYPDNTLKIETQVSEISETLGNAYVVCKSDHLRFIARKQETPSINGDILILKEGTKDVDLSYFFMEKTGKIQIEGQKIYFGKAVLEDSDSQQPYIKYQQYKQTVNHLQDQIDKLNNHIKQLGDIIENAFKTAIAIPASPIASLTAASPQIQVLTNATNQEIDQLSNQTDNKITSCRSEKIFGE